MIKVTDDERKRSLGRRLVGVRVSLDTEKMKAEERAELDSYAAMSTQGFTNSD